MLDTVRAFDDWADGATPSDDELPRGVGMHRATLRGVAFERFTVSYTLWMVQRAARRRTRRSIPRPARRSWPRSPARAARRCWPTRRGTGSCGGPTALPRALSRSGTSCSRVHIGLLSRHGAEDPLHHHRPAALRRARLQRRHGRAHAGRRPARGRRRQLSTRAQPERRLHAGALDDGHRTVRAHARRRSPTASRCRPTRRAWRRRSHGPAIAPRCIGKAHFEPAMDMRGRWFENRMAREGSTGPYRGFEHMELAMHVPLRAAWHYSLFIQREHPEAMSGFAPLLSARGRRRDRRARGGVQPDRARVVPHRLGRRPHHRVARRARPPTPTGSAG